ncbi:MAG: hypothetical protein KDD51_05410 [Bdellovibrionales bacterium]|nr:hypothetical protein [Bdellovibrionales bacterium]
MLRGILITFMLLALTANAETRFSDQSALEAQKQSPLSRANISSERDFLRLFGASHGRNVPRHREARPPKASDANLNFDFLKLMGAFATPIGTQTDKPVTAGVPGVGFDFGAGGNNQSQSSSGSTSSSTSTSSNASGSDGAATSKIGFNDAAPDGRDSVELRGNDNGRQGPALPPGGGTGSADSVFNPLFKPVCFLIDPANANANAVIKDFVDAYASCGVTAVPFAFTIRQNYPDQPDLINNLAKQVCPLSSVLGVGESSIQTHVRFDTTADRMCDSWEDKSKDKPTKNVAGCAVFVKPRHFTPDPKKAKDFSQNSSHHFGGSGADGKDAVSIVDVNQSSSVAIHEVQHNNGGVNVGEGDGEKPHGYGIESVGNEPNRAGSGDAFTGEGCAHIRSASNPNDGTYMYSPSRTTYYVPIDNPRYQRDLMAGRSFFDSGAGPPPLSPIPPNNNPELPLATAPRGKQEIVAGPPSKHKKKKPGGVGPVVQAPTRGGPLSGDSNSFFGSAGGPQRGPTEGANKIGFNDQAPESTALSKDFFGDGKTSKIGFNDDAPEQLGAIATDFFDKSGAPGGEAPGGEAPGGQAPGEAAASRLLASVGDKKGGKDQESKLDKDFFDEKQRKKKAQQDPSAYDSTIRKETAPALSTGNQGGQDIGALSSDTSLFSADTNLFEKGASFIRSVSEQLGNLFDDSYFQDVKGQGQKPDASPEERVRVIRTEDIY